MILCGSLQYSIGNVISFDDNIAVILETYYENGFWKSIKKQTIHHNVSRYNIYDTYSNLKTAINNRFKGELVYSAKCFELKIGQEVYFTKFEFH